MVILFFETSEQTVIVYNSARIRITRLYWNVSKPMVLAGWFSAAGWCIVSRDLRINSTGYDLNTREARKQALNKRQK